MPTKERRLNFTIDPETMAAIDEYRFSEKCESLSEALRQLINQSLQSWRASGAAGPSREALRLAQSYDKLDAFGKKALAQTAERERERMAAQQDQARRPLAARGFGEAPLDLSAVEPISLDEVVTDDLDC